MDLFKYKAAEQQIKSTKYVKDLNTLVRKYRDLANSVYLKYTHMLKDSNLTYQEIKHIYKLYALALQTYSNKSKAELPEMIYQDFNKSTTSVIEQIIDSDTNKEANKFYIAKNYLEIMDLLEYTDTIYMPVGEDYLSELDSIVLDNPFPLEVIWNVSLSYFDIRSTELTQEAQFINYAIRHKQVNFLNSSRTLWDRFTKDCIEKEKEPIKTQEIDSSIIKLKQQITALETLKENHAI